MAIYVPIIMYGLTLCIIVLQELQCLPKFGKFIYSWISISSQVPSLNSVRFLRYAS